MHTNTPQGFASETYDGNHTREVRAAKEACDQINEMRAALHDGFLKRYRAEGFVPPQPADTTQQIDDIAWKNRGNAQAIGEMLAADAKFDASPAHDPRMKELYALYATLSSALRYALERNDPDRVVPTDDTVALTDGVALVFAFENGGAIKIVRGGPEQRKSSGWRDTYLYLEPEEAISELEKKIERNTAETRERIKGIQKLQDLAADIRDHQI